MHEQRTRLNYLQMGPMLCVVVPKRWTIMELSSASATRPCLKFAAHCFDVLHYDLDEYAVTPCPTAFAMELLQQIEAKRFVLVLEQPIHRGRCHLEALSDWATLLRQVVETSRIFVIWTSTEDIHTGSLNR